MKKVAVLTAILLLAASLLSCESIPVSAATTTMPPLSSMHSAAASPTVSLASSLTPSLTPSAEETNTPDPSVSVSNGDTNTMKHYFHLTKTGIPDLQRFHISDEQYYNIFSLLSGALSMSADYSNTCFFENADSLSADNLLRFVYIILNNTGVDVGVERTSSCETVSSEAVEDIIRSAFGVNYTPKEGDGLNSLLEYDGENFEFGASDDISTDLYTYSITDLDSGQLLFKFNIVCGGPPDDTYIGKGQAVLQKDPSSLFGYHLISLTAGKDKNISFTRAKASSSLPVNEGRKFTAINAIDGKDDTAWATDKGVGEWIKLSFGKREKITGLILHFGDWSNDGDLYNSGMPIPFNLEFSDGTVIKGAYDGYTNEADFNPCITFGKAIKTSYVKITITDIADGSAGAGGGFYISEIKPF